MNLKVFDAHMHIGRWGSHNIQGREINPFRDQEFESADKLLAHLERFNVDRAVDVPIYSLDPLHAFQTNSLVLESVKALPQRIVPGLWVDPSPGVRSQLFTTVEMALKNNVKVLKTSPETWEGDYSPDPSTWDGMFGDCIKLISDHARATGSIIQIHTGSGKSDIRLIEKFIRYIGPGVCFHLVHMGNTTRGHFYLVPRLRQWIEEGLQIVCDISLARGFAVRWLCGLARKDPVLRKAIMFASDEPWGVFQSEVAKISDATNGNTELMEAIFWANAMRVYSSLGDLQ